MIKITSKCDFCNGDINIKEVYYENEKVLACFTCRGKLKKRYLLKYKIQIKEITLRKAIIELINDNWNKTDILFILDIDETRFKSEIKRLQNLVRGKKDRGKLYEGF